MTINNTCPFCDIERLKTMIPDAIPCRHDIDEDEHCLAILAREQYTHGHTLAVLKQHKADITDDVSEADLLHFINFIHKIATHLKAVATNDRGEHPDNIYVCILCDGVKHLHAHLVPRYPFSIEDIETYKSIIGERDGEEAVRQAIEKGDLGGFWYVAVRERDYKQTTFWKLSDSARAKHLEQLAAKMHVR
jgi:diadenosine tetraphosphate (Ap4A) HIT family hydrolase